jgi:peptidoglycan/xylan/chitin deacetylase (PgdA/CDA1 family)
MSLDPSHLAYPMRRHGMDHDRYAWSMLSERTPIRWPDGRALALWINVSVEHFPLDATGEGVKAHGSMTMPYPDLRHYTLRDYGNRVGIYRVLKALAQRGLVASFAVNGEVAIRYPALVRRLAATGGEIVAHGWNMDHVHSGAIDSAREAQWIDQTLAALAPYAPTPIRGWLSPARSQSASTPELLTQRGIDWCADWVNDELPYRFETSAGRLAILPLSWELEDRFVIGENQHAESEWADQCCDAADFLLAEAERSGASRLLSLSLHPWVIGQPHRIRHLERVLDHLVARHGRIWNAAPSAILAHAAPTTGA